MPHADYLKIEDLRLRASNLGSTPDLVFRVAGQGLKMVEDLEALGLGHPQPPQPPQPSQPPQPLQLTQVPSRLRLKARRRLQRPLPRCRNRLDPALRSKGAEGAEGVKRLKGLRIPSSVDFGLEVLRG